MQPEGVGTAQQRSPAMVVAEAQQAYKFFEEYGKRREGCG
jgi:hypothetical protein